ncbi:unnamed protein product [Arctia plantaginis]|uniref:Uncharacterized protein n=1 Tax=Arctia plantaginis TaxID=874455 RepID=A0A8S1A951_ARCPL|nr:unnamed protein product [Arctia plantaginis]
MSSGRHLPSDNPTRRVKILEKNIIPKTLRTINYIRSELEDKEREEIFRFTIVQHKRFKWKKLEKIQLEPERTLNALVKNGILENAEMFKASLPGRPLNSLSNLHLLTSNFTKHFLYIVAMIPSEFNHKHVTDPCTSCTYKMLKRDAGHHNISDPNRSHMTASESLTTLAGDNLIIIKTSEESDSDDNFIPPRGLNIFGGITEVIDLIGESLSDNIFAEISKSEPPVIDRTLSIPLGDQCSNVLAIVSSAGPQTSLNISALTYILLTLRDLKTRWAREFLRLVQLIISFFCIQDPDCTDFYFDQEERTQTLRLHFNVTNPPQTCLVIPDIDGVEETEYRGEQNT